MDEKARKELVEKLVALKKCAEDGCDAAFKDEDCRKDAVNWSDFGCIEASYFVNDDGETGLKVLLEEADPNCPNVQAFVAAWLFERGFENVEVWTEW